MKQMKIGVIGGGAAGMMAAITASAEGADVTVLEGGERVGRKLLSTGNGKCNLGNLQLTSEDYYGASREWLEDCLGRFGTRETIRFFQGIGLLLKEKNGYLYPLAEQAAVVLDALRAELCANGVTLVTECRVKEIQLTNENKDGRRRFTVLAESQSFEFDKVILACGGRAAPKTGSDGSGYLLAKSLGHKIIPVVPALVQLRCREQYLREVAGVRAEAAIRIMCGRKTDSEWMCERGELQLTDYGISGIPVFQLSRRVNYLIKELGKNSQVEVSVDLLPDCGADEFEKLCKGRRLLHGDRTVEEFFNGILHKKLMFLFIKLAGLKRNMPVSEAEEAKLETVFALCKDWRLHVTGSNSFDNAQVCAGGVDTREVSRNMESTRVPGLYFAGEILDVDGRCGGYNLQWAWCSGYLAGKCASAENMKEIHI